MSLLRDIRDPARAGSIARRARERRFQLFRDLVGRLDRPVAILDVGGTPEFWREMGFDHEPGVSLTIANIVSGAPAPPGVETVEADACDLHMFADGQFDVVFSNSVIEHVGGPDRRRAMAREIQRVGRRYFVQTPNRWFPIEPHFVFPLFQFLPVGARRWLLMNLDLAWSGRIRSREAAESVARSVELLGRREFTSLFPGARVYRERFLGLTKSFVCYAGW